MRLDLTTGGTRRWWMKLLMRGAKARVGVVPGPAQVMSYRPELTSGGLARYLLRGMSGHGQWTRSEAELMAAYVSNLNACHF